MYSSSNDSWTMKSRRMGWAERVACTGEKTNTYRVWLGNLNARTQLGKLGLDEGIILMCLLKIKIAKAD